MSDIIKVFQGNLLEGETVELFADFSCNYVSNLFYNKSWIVLGEKDLKFDTLTQEYYNDIGKTNIFKSKGDDYITLTDLKVGRYLAIFKYTDLLGNDKEERSMLTIYPKYSLVYDKNITEGDTKTIQSNTTLLNTSSYLTFSDNNENIILSNTVVNRTFPIEGYYNINIEVEYNNSRYDEEGEPLVVWNSQPSNRLTGVEGPYGGATVVNQSFTNTTSDVYLTKLELSNDSISDKINLDINVNFNGQEAFAPVNLFINDYSSYFTFFGDKKQYWDMTKNLPTDDYVPLVNGEPDPNFFLPINDIFSGDHRIDYTEFQFGDGQIIRGKNVGFTYQKNYEKSGLYQLKFSIFTRHYVSLTEETNDTKLSGLIKDIEDGRLYYTNSIVHIEDLEVKAFFTKWLRDHSAKSLYNTKGFQDISTAVGKQLDRVYNQGKSIIDSIDVETIDDKFIKSYFETYGDFEKVASKIGFTAFSNDKDNIYDFLQDYNFFDRAANGKITKEEKSEFLNYVKTTQKRLQTKGTPYSIERELSNFGIDSSVIELWTDDMDKVSRDDVLTDEVFSGKIGNYNTGLTFDASSTPSSNNTTSLVINSDKNSYIEIDSFNNRNNYYYTKDTPITQMGCQKYARFSNVVSKDVSIDYLYESLFDEWADNCIGQGLWARKYTNDFNVFGNFSWIDLVSQNWGDSVLDTLKQIGTNVLYQEFIRRWGEVGETIWNDYNLQTWHGDIVAPTTFIQGVSGSNTILSLESGQIIFGEYSQKSFEVGTTLYFKTNDKLVNAYIKDYHGVVENCQSLNDGVWETDITNATTYLDGNFHYKVTIPTNSNYFKGWVFSRQDGFVFTSEEQFRLDCQKEDILNVDFTTEETTTEEDDQTQQSNITSFVEANFRCIPVIPEPVVVPEEEQETIPSEFSSELESSRMDLIIGKSTNNSTISAFNKCVEIADRSKLASGLSLGDYAYFGTTEKLTYAVVKDLDGNEYSLEYKTNNSFIKPQSMTELSNVEDVNGIYYYRWRVTKDNFIFNDTSAFKFKSLKNFDINIFNSNIYNEIINQTDWANMHNIIWGASSLLTWEDLFIGTNFNEIILL